MKCIRAVHTGISGFPFGSAAIYKCMSVYKSLRDIGVEMTILNNRAIHAWDIPYDLQKTGVVDGIRYVYTTPSPYKPRTFLARRYFNIAGRLGEIWVLFRLHWHEQLDLMFYYPQGSVLNVLLYRLLSSLFGIPLVCHYVEYRSSFEMKKTWWNRLSDVLFDKYFTCLVDAVLPISRFLEDRVRSGACPKPLVRVPPTTDFDLFIDNDVQGNRPEYFLYAGHAGYVVHLSMVVQSFEQLKDHNMQLYLIVYGNPAEIAGIQSLIREKGLSDQVRIFNRLQYEELLRMYRGAGALLIPLTGSLQDRARFPYKIAEYVATGNPIITTGFGEVLHFFEDMKTALVARDFRASLIAEKMQFVVHNPIESRAIGAAARKMGYNVFHYTAYNNALKRLIDHLLQ